MLTYTATVRQVTATLREHEHDLAKPQTKVTVVLPSGTETAGTVSAVRTAGEAPTGGAAEPMVDVLVALDDHAALTGTDDGPVRVRFVVRERRNVLMVPVGALLALAEGGYGLEVVEGDAVRVVAVTTGLFANGNVEVSGAGIGAGTVVGMSR